MNNEAAATLLIVDDVPASLGALFDVLHGAGYEVLTADSGERALAVLDHALPDLILLDVMLPGIDGFETCRRIRTKLGAEIPVLFMSALSDPVDKTQGLDAGAVDYVTKPLEFGEVLARVRVHLELRRTRQALQLRNEQLRVFAAALAHDLRSPLQGVAGLANLLSLAKSAGTLAPEREFEHLVDIEQTATFMNRQVDSILHLMGLLHDADRDGRVDAVTDMGAVVDEVLRVLQPQLDQVGAEVNRPQHWPAALPGYGPWVSQVWLNYLANAIKYGGRPLRISLGWEAIVDGYRFWVEDNGPGLDSERSQDLFKPFSRIAGEAAEGHGVGLAIVALAVRGMGGTVGVDSEPGRGSRFHFSLPLWNAT